MKHFVLPSVILLSGLLNAPVRAESCQQQISRAQVQVDAAVDRQAGNGPWKTESLAALRRRQPTPQSIAAAEGTSSAALTHALDALNRARMADGAGEPTRCRAEVSTAQHLLAPF
jgi:hypothetical protein